MVIHFKVTSQRTAANGAGYTSAPRTASPPSFHLSITIHRNNNIQDSARCLDVKDSGKYLASSEILTETLPPPVNVVMQYHRLPIESKIYIC